MNYKQYQTNHRLASAIVEELNDWLMHEDLHFEAIDRDDNDEGLVQKMQMLQCEDVIKILCKQLLNNLDDVD